MNKIFLLFGIVHYQFLNCNPNIKNTKTITNKINNHKSSKNNKNQIKKTNGTVDTKGEVFNQSTIGILIKNNPNGQIPQEEVIANPLNELLAAKQNQIKVLESDLVKVQSHLSNIENEKHTLQNELHNIKNTSSELLQTKKELMDTIKKLNKQNQELIKKNQEAEEAIINLQKSIDRIIEEANQNIELHKKKICLLQDIFKIYRSYMMNLNKYLGNI